MSVQADNSNGSKWRSAAVDSISPRRTQQERVMNAVAEQAQASRRTYVSVVEQMLKGRTHYFAEVVDVSPGLASALLSGHNKVNRPLVEKRSKFYGEEMKGGHWRLSSGAIGIDVNQQLTNGQHRLQGVVFSGVSVPFAVAFNCDAAARSVEDCGRPRSEADRLTLSGTEATRNLVAVARAFLHMPDQVARNSSVTPIEELRGIVEDYRRQMELAIELCQGDSGGMAHAVIIACVARAAVHCGESRVREFCEVSRSGMAENSDDQAAAYFYKWMRSTHCESIRSGGQVKRFELYKCTQSAIRAFVERREIKSIKPTHEDLFPLPE